MSLGGRDREGEQANPTGAWSQTSSTFLLSLSLRSERRLCGGQAEKDREGQLSKHGEGVVGWHLDGCRLSWPRPLLLQLPRDVLEEADVLTSSFLRGGPALRPLASSWQLPSSSWSPCHSDAGPCVSA